MFQLLRVRNDGDALQQLVTSNMDYQNIGRDTAMMMRELADIKLPRKNKEGKYNMCKAIMEIQEKGIKAGIEKGIEKGTDNTWVLAIKNLMETTQKTFEEACTMLCIPDSDRIKYRDMI